MEDLIECTHLSLAEPGNHVHDLRLEAGDVQLVQLRRCDLAFAEEVKKCCKGVKRTGVVDHVLPKRLPHVGLKPCVVAPKLMYSSAVMAKYKTLFVSAVLLMCQSMRLCASLPLTRLML